MVDFKENEPTTGISEKISYASLGRISSFSRERTGSGDS